MKIVCAILRDHKWSPPDVNPQTCIETQICQRCGEKDVQEKHLWSEWEYIEPGSCEQKMHCTRCGIEIMSYGHKYSIDGKCQRCGDYDYRPSVMDSEENSETGRKPCGCPDPEDPDYHLLYCPETQKYL